MSEKSISRRELLKRAPFLLALPATLANSACQAPKSVRPEQARVPTPVPTLTQKELEAQTIRRQILAELDRLSAPYPEGSTIRKVYRGRLSEVSPIFPNYPKLRLIDPSFAIAFDFSDYVNSPSPRFRYRLNNNGSVKDYKTLDHTDITFFIPPTWLRLSDETKEFVMDKEAKNLKVFDDFAKHIILPTYIPQGTIEKIDLQVTEAEIARTFAMDQLSNNGNLLKIYDYYGYLAKFEDIARLEGAGNQKVLQELDDNSNIIEIYKKAKGLNIPFRTLEVGSLEFLKVAFGGNNTPWIRLVLDPSTPGPYKP